MNENTHLSFTYNFTFYPPSSQRLLPLLKKDIESTHFFNLRASFHTFGFICIGTEHIILNHTWYKTCKLLRIAKKNYLIILKTCMFLNYTPNNISLTTELELLIKKWICWQISYLLWVNLYQELKKNNKDLELSTK